MVGVKTVVPVPASRSFPISLSGFPSLKIQNPIDAQKSIGFRYLRAQLNQQVSEWTLNESGGPGISS